MINRGLTMALVMAAAILAAGSANADDFVIDQTIDIGGYTGYQSIIQPLPAPILVSAGDSIDLTVHFAAGQALRMGDGSEAFLGWLDGVGHQSWFTINNASVHFIGFQGSAGTSDTLFSAGETNGVAHLGPMFNNFLSAGQFIEFTGYHVTFDVTALWDYYTSVPGPNTYGNIWFLQFGNDVSQVPVRPVPEPATMVLLATGILGLVGARKFGER